MRTRASARHPPRQRGSIAVLTGMTLFIMIGMLGLVLDLGHLYVVKTEMQNAADACALSAAQELSSYNASTADRARQAGIAAGSANLVDFQAAPAVIEPADITFGADLAAAPNGEPLNFSGVVGQDTHYARCMPHGTVHKSVVMWFMGAFGIGAQDIHASSIARQAGGGTCSVPLAVCTDDPTASNMHFVPGDWYNGRLEAGSAVRGNYGWVRFPGQDTGTSAQSDAIAGKGMCELTNTKTVLQNSGITNGVSKAWNTRFGLYGAPFKRDEQNMLDHPPDLTGWAYQNHVAGGVYGDFQARERAHTPYDPYNIVDKKGKPVDFPGTPQPLLTSDHATYGGQRRVLAMPVISCNAWGANDDKKVMDVVGWACSLMVAPSQDAQGEISLEFIATTLDGNCGIAGASGASKPTKLVR
ncbi:MAG: pilus assembly protein TadG-related protein [Pseudomonadota bacterium]